jgi:hypothetical protein
MDGQLYNAAEFADRDRNVGDNRRESHLLTCDSR